jgi:hypothetical protein
LLWISAAGIAVIASYGLLSQLLRDG